MIIKLFPCAMNLLLLAAYISPVKDGSFGDCIKLEKEHYATGNSHF